MTTTSLIHNKIINRLFIAVVLTAICSLGTQQAEAELVLRNINQTLSGSELAIDLDQDGNNDFTIIDDGAGSSQIVPINQADLGVLLTPEGTPVQFSLGDTIDSDSGIRSHGVIYIFGGQNPSAFEEPGSTGFIGLSLKDNETETPFLGWAQISRGSTIVGAVGFQTTPGASVIVSIPEPTSLAVLAIGMFGALIPQRRRG